MKIELGRCCGRLNAVSRGSLPGRSGRDVGKYTWGLGRVASQKVPGVSGEGGRPSAGQPAQVVMPGSLVCLCSHAHLLLFLCMRFLTSI